MQNVGADGQEVSETITTLRALDRVRQEIVELPNSDCGFSYRKSIFNTTERDRYIVLSVTYELRPGGAPKVDYGDLRNELADDSSDLHSVREAVLRIRRSKSMVIDASDPNTRCICGWCAMALRPMNCGTSPGTKFSSTCSG